MNGFECRRLRDEYAADDRVVGPTVPDRRRAAGARFRRSRPVPGEGFRRGVVGKKARRFAERPRITTRALMWFVLIVALFNGLCMFLARRLHSSGLPIDQANRQGIFVFVLLNGLALILCLHIFYCPW
jgi:hypothetical protein